MFDKIYHIIINKDVKLAIEFSSCVKVEKFSENLLRRVIEILSNEFCEMGLIQSSDPIQYGLEIEDLIDLCNNLLFNMD